MAHTPSPALLCVDIRAPSTTHRRPSLEPTSCSWNGSAAAPGAPGPASSALSLEQLAVSLPRRLLGNAGPILDQRLGHPAATANPREPLAVGGDHPPLRPSRCSV